MVWEHPAGIYEILTCYFCILKNTYMSKNGKMFLV